MLKRIMSVLLIAAILTTGVATAAFADTPLAQRIQDEQTKVKTLMAERDKLSQQYNKVNNSIMQLGKLRLQLNNAAINRAVVLSTRLFIDAISAITTELLDLGINLAQQLAGVDEWFQIETSEQHGDAYVRANKMAEACTSLISFCENKRSELLTKIDEKKKAIEASKTEIKRLKDLYKQATGDEYVLSSDPDYSQAVTLSLEENLGKSQPSEGSFNLAYDAANSVYTNLKLEQGWGMSQPVIVYQGDNNPLIAFRAYVSGPAWDGTLESFGRQDFTYGPYEYWVYVKQAANGKYSLMDMEIIHLPRPKITANDASLEFERGKTVELQADVECFDGYTPNRVVWYAEEGDIKKKIGEGIKVSWSIPENIGSFRVFAYAEDSLHGVSQYAVPRYIYPEYYHLRTQEEEFKCSPAVPEHGDEAAVSVDLWFTNPCDVEVDWKVPATIGGSTPSLDMAKAPTVTTGAYRVGTATTPGNQTVYVYRANFEYPVNGYDSKGKPLNDSYVYYTVRSKTGSVVRDNQQSSMRVKMGSKHFEQFTDKQKELGKQDAEKLLAEYNQKLAQYKVESALFLKVNSDQLTSKLSDLNARGGGYIDWRLGLAAADEAWGQNYTVSLFRDDSKACMEILKAFADANGYSSMDIIAALNDNTGEDFDVVMLRRMKVASSYLSKVEEWINRQASFSKLYQELGSMHYDKLQPAAKKGDITLPEEPQQFQGSYANEFVFQTVKNELPANIARYPVSAEQRQKAESAIQTENRQQNDAKQASVSGYTDVREGQWFAEQVKQLSSRGVLAGKGNGIFAPNDTVTRAQISVAIIKLIKYGERYPEGFSDVKPEDWFGPYVGAMTQNGILSGYGGGRFGPNDFVTREQAAVMIIKAYQSVLKKLPVSGELQALDFKDKDQVSSWAVEYMKQATQSGFFNGTGNQMLSPKKTLTRAEMAVLLYGLLNSIRSDATYQGDIQ